MDSQQLSRAWRDFARGRLSPAEMASELCDILDTEFGAPDPEDPHSLNEARERVWSLLGLVHDVERRASLAMAYLNLRPGVATCDWLALSLAFVVNLVYWLCTCLVLSGAVSSRSGHFIHLTW